MVMAFNLIIFFIEPGNIHTRKETCINLFNKLNGVKP